MRVASLAAALVLAASPLHSANQDVERAVESVQAAIESGDRTLASRLLAEALAHYPRDAGLFNLRGVIHAQQAELAEARADFQEAVRLSPSLTAAWQNLGRACQILSERDTSAISCATAAWEHVLHSLPGDVEARASLATLYEWQGKFAASLRELGKLPENEAASSALVALRCADLAGLKRPREAADAGHRLAQSPGFSENDVLSILPVLDSTHSNDLIVSLAEALDAAGRASPATLRDLAVAYEQSNRLADARRILERVAVAEPGKTEHLFELARLAYRLHDPEGSLGYLGHARDLTPNDGRVHFLFGLVAVEMRLPVEARRSLDKALALDPQNPEYNYAMGAVLLSGNAAAEAVPYLARYVGLRPGDPRGHLALGDAYFETMDYEKCRLEVQGISKVPATEAGAAYLLGRVARVEENFDEALVQLNRAIKLTPAFAEAHTEMARVYMALGQLTEARAAAARAVELDPDGFQANTALLQVLRLTHDPAEEKQSERLRTLDAERSRRRELLLRTLEVKPY